MSKGDTNVRARVVALLTGICLCVQMPVLLAQSDLAEVLTIQASSDIGQPLQAQINVGSLPSLQGDISVSLASQRAFESLDIGRYQVLTSLRFGMRMNSAENYLLDISSVAPLYEPSLRFVVAFQGDGETSLMPIEVLIPVLDASGIERPTLLSRPNETLWRIANRTRDDDVTNAQQMLAVLQLNPNSFLASNINGLKPWSMLALPDFAEAQATSRRQAELQVAEQNASWQSGVRDGQGVSQTAGQVRITAFDKTADFEEDPVVEVDESTVSAAPQAVMEEASDQASDQALGTTPEETSDKALEGTLAVDEPLIDQEPEPLANMPDNAQQSRAVVDDPFDLDQIEQQIRAEESGVFTRVLDTVLASGSVGLLAGIAIIVLLVVVLVRRRAVQQEQELDGVLGSRSDDASGLESDQAEPTVSIAAPQPDPSEEQNENGAFAAEELRDDEDDDDSAQEDVFTTRLKLAEAYIEMGDEDGARDMLQEVIADGSAEQQDVARRIMARLDGGDD